MSGGPVGMANTSIQCRFIAGKQPSDPERRRKKSQLEERSHNSQRGRDRKPEGRNDHMEIQVLQPQRG